MDFKDLFSFLFLLFYLLYTFSFALKFNKTNIYYSKKQKLVHNIMIWIIPFLWIMILKTIDKPNLGRLTAKKNMNTSNIGDAGWWGLGLYSFFHGSNDSSPDDSSGYDTGGGEGFCGYDGGGGDGGGGGEGD